MITANFDNVIRSWLDAHPDDRDPAQGALILLRVDRNKVFYAQASANPRKYIKEIESRLRSHLTRRQAIPSPEQVQALAREADGIMHPSASIKAIKGGKRPDHDSLPDEIKALYVENLELRHKMQQYHLQIRTLLGSEAECSREDIRDLVKLLRDTDVKYLRNWKQYDEYEL